MKLNNETAAEKIYDAALKRFNNAHEIWLGDVHMMQVQTDDYLDLIKVANLVNNEQLGEAAKAMFILDTEVRDTIPDDVFNWVVNSR